MLYVSTPQTGKKDGDYTELLTPLKLTKGVIKSVEVWFPVGNAGLHQVQLLLNKKLLLPHNNGAFLVGDGVNLKYDMSHIVNEPPYELSILTRNYDHVYPHSVQVRVSVKTFSEIAEEQENVLLLSKIKEEIKALRDEIGQVAIKQRTQNLSKYFGRNNK